MDGFIGHECTIQVDDCENSIGYSPSDPTGVLMHSCYHGSTCKNFGNGNMCDCDELNISSAPDAKKFAGLMCEHESTSLCAVSLVGMSASNHQFCTNHGRCKKEVIEGAPHPKCDCRDGWSGDHCEIRSDVFANTLETQSRQGVTNMNVGGKVLFSFIVIAVITVVIGTAILVYSQVKKNRGPSEKAVGKTAADVGAGEIEMDGSSTLSPTKSNITEEDEGGGEGGDDGNNDLALKEEDDTIEDAAAAATDEKQAFTITDSYDDEEVGEGSGSDSEPDQVLV
jgi:hypothetical protein